MRLVIALAALLIPACGGDTQERLNTGAGSYAIPSEHISTVTRDPHTFVRIKHPEKVFDLVFDSRSRRAQAGAGIPRIFSVNDKGQTGIEYHQGEGGLIVCRKAVHPNSGCGARMEHRGTEWTVLFPIQRLNQANQIIREAATLLDRYAV